MDDPFNATPAGGSKLDSLFAQDKQWQGTGNQSLSYKPKTRKEVRKKAQMELEASRALQNPPAADTTTSQANNAPLKFATPGNLIQYEAGNPVQHGPKGLALVSNNGQGTLVIYDLQTQQRIVVIAITETFELIVQDNFYCSFWDTTPTLWAFQLGTAEAQQALITHVSLFKFAMNNTKTVTTNLAPVSADAKTLSTGDKCLVSYTLHLLTNSQLCPAPTVEIETILGESIENDTAKTLSLGNLKRDIPCFDSLIDGVKDIPRLIIAPASLAYGSKENNQIPPNSNVAIVVTTKKVKYADGEKDKSDKGEKKKKREARVEEDNEETDTLTPLPEITTSTVPLEDIPSRSRSASISVASGTVPGAGLAVESGENDDDDEEAERRRRLATRMGRLSMAQRGMPLPADDSQLPVSSTPSASVSVTPTPITSPAVAPSQSIPPIEEPQPQTQQYQTQQQSYTPISEPSAIASMPESHSNSQILSPSVSHHMSQSQYQPHQQYPPHQQPQQFNSPYYNQPSYGYSPMSQPPLPHNSQLDQLTQRIEAMHIQLTGGIFKNEALSGAQLMQSVSRLVTDRDNAVNELESKEKQITELQSRIADLRLQQETLLDIHNEKNKERYASYRDENAAYQEQIIALQTDKRSLMMKQNEALLRVSELEMAVELGKQELDMKVRQAAGEKMVELRKLIEEAEQKVTIAENNATLAQDAKSTLENEKISLQERLVALQTELVQTKDLIKSEITKTTAANENNNTLNTQLTEAMSEITRLKDLVATRDQEINNLNTSNASHLATIASLNTTVPSSGSKSDDDLAQAVQAALAQAKIDFENEIAVIKNSANSESAALKSTISDLEAKLASAPTASATCVSAAPSVCEPTETTSTESTSSHVTIKADVSDVCVSVCQDIYGEFVGLLESIEEDIPVSTAVKALKKAVKTTVGTYSDHTVPVEVEQRHTTVTVVRESVKEVVKEVPVEVQVEVIKEIIKEVPVEVQVIKEIIKEVPVEVQVEVIKEVQVPVSNTDNISENTSAPTVCEPSSEIESIQPSEADSVIQTQSEPDVQPEPITEDNVTLEDPSVPVENVVESNTSEIVETETVITPDTNEKSTVNESDKKSKKSKKSKSKSKSRGSVVSKVVEPEKPVIPESVPESESVEVVDTIIQETPEIAVEETVVEEAKPSVEDLPQPVSEGEADWETVPNQVLSPKPNSSLFSDDDEEEESSLFKPTPPPVIKPAAKGSLFDDDDDNDDLW